MEDNKDINNNPTKNEIVKGKIANALTSAAKNHIVATTDDIYDTNLLEYQDEINQSIIETLSGVAKEDTLVNGISDIREDISEIELDTSDLAKEDTLTQGINDIIDKIETTQPDLSTVAKEDTLVTGITNINNNVDSQANAVTSTINSKTENIIGTVNGQANAVIDTVNSQAGNVINSVNTSTTNVVEGKAGAIIDTVNAQGQSIKGPNDEATNTAILSAITNIDFSALAKQGSDVSVSLTTINEALGNLVMITDDEYVPALEELSERLI